ncbi:MAG: galactose ABC transporter substrate-binding protein [Candidatus Izimaplasma sp.]|nr:galactose ABC transporter substrate-binding protein [Candidatus Izimaplasma bacterium]
MKKLIIAFLFISLGLFLTGCRTKEVEVPLIIYDYDDLYMQQFEELIYDNKNYNSYRFESYDSKNSQIIQNDIINDVFLDNPRVIIVNPVDRLGVYPIIEKAKEKDVPIIFINREPLKEDMYSYDQLFYVGAKPEQSAIFQADIIIDLFGGNSYYLNELDKNNDNNIQCVILKGEPGHQDAEIRTERVVQELTDRGFHIDILIIEEAYFSQEIAKEKMTDLLVEFGNTIELVISNNDAMAIGAIEVLKEEGYFVDENDNGVIDRDTETWMPVVGIDGLPIALELIDQGYLSGTVLNDSKSMALAINELTNALVTGEKLSDIMSDLEDDKYIWIDYKKYTPNDK